MEIDSLKGNFGMVPCFKLLPGTSLVGNLVKVEF